MHLALGILIAFAASFLLIAALDFIASRRWQKSANLHWAERARLLFPARQTTNLNFFLLPCFAVVFGLNYTKHSPALIPFAFSALIGGILGAIPLERKIFPQLTIRQWFTQLLQGWGTRILLFGPFFLVGFLMPDEWSWPLFTIAITFAIFYLWFGSVGYFQLLIWLRLFKPSSPETSALLEPCFTAANIRPRSIWTMQSPLALAFAVPTRRELLFSDSFLTKLSTDEIKAVTYHELAHLSEDKLTIARRMLGLLIFYPFIFIRPLIATWGLAGFVPIYVIFFLLLFLNLRLGKKMELRADTEALDRLTDQSTYARALEKLYRLNQFPAVMPNRGQIHPHLYDRMLAAGVTPDFPRPAAPGTFHWTALIPIILLTVIIFVRI